MPVGVNLTSTRILVEQARSAEQYEFKNQIRSPFLVLDRSHKQSARRLAFLLQLSQKEDIAPFSLNRQDACSTIKFISCGTGILPVHKRILALLELRNTPL